MKNIMFAFLGLAATGFVLTTSSCADPCKDVTCVNGACQDVDGDGICACDAGYEGTDCGTEERAKMIGTYSGTDDCSGSGATGPFNSSIANASSSVQGVIISGLWGNGFINNVTATIDGSTITIPSQEPDGDDYFIVGSGEYSSGVISWTYTVTGDGASDVCNMTGTKQ